MPQLQYRSTHDLNKCIVDHLHKIPEDIDLVVGVPRSGMLAGTLFALYLDLPMTDVKGLIEGRVMAGGDRLRWLPVKDYKKVLVVDDCVFSGTELRNVRAQLDQAELGYELIFCCPYARHDRARDVDIYFEVLPGDRWIFEWNKLNHGMVDSMCVDMDGVLCRDPSLEEDDDGARYLHFLETAEPKLRPRRKIGWIVTSRLEKYRPQTEAWLKRHNIEYGELHMMNLPSLEERTGYLAAKHKATIYNQTPSSLFIESALWPAQEISRLSGRPVLCTQNSQLIQPTAIQASRGKLTRSLYRLLRKFKPRLRTEGARILPLTNMDIARHDGK
jgi:orotate phosphoribosyltransferase